MKEQNKLKDLKNKLNEMETLQAQKEEALMEPNSFNLPSEKLTFDWFKLKIKNKLEQDKLLSQMRLSFYEDEQEFIIYQGVRTNILARFNNGKRYRVYRTNISKRLKGEIDMFYNQ